MKAIRKIAGKVTALLVAVMTTVTLLNPYYLQAYDSVDDYVDMYDSEAEDYTGSGSGSCGFVQESFTCSNSTAINYQNNSSGNIVTQWSSAFGYQPPYQFNISGSYTNSNAYVYQNMAAITYTGNYVMKCFQRGYGIRECTSEACPGQFQPAVQKCAGTTCK
ncbi:hypothetical protein [Haliscomenobacter hydrossis]|uniref:Uncharacterized protein n=1 Tax=Haliscomenobacter hydrossis (strain ATCC 27775 / DSM 1100 / LMG 10767 / O) TaxID=760192 RepID=F4L338_HALH1|nr:hypothetical protein [Haliscomenobacter hydrossis]AEE50697.1 hypothetical protein Halhy_2831 [Haliscomenobacter hydrossis DSM 1100]